MRTEQLLPETKVDEVLGVAPFNTLAVNTLANALRAKRLLSAKPIPRASWEEVFRKLVNVHGEKLVDLVLRYTVDRLGDKELPRILSATSFASRFDKLRKLMEEGVGVGAFISEDTATLCTELRTLHWPGGLEGSLLLVIQRSLENYSAYFNKVKTLRWKLNETPDKSRSQKRLQGLLGFLLSMGYLTRPRQFIRGWMEHWSRSLARWEGATFQGSGTMLVWTDDSPTFQQMGRGWAYEYCHEAKMWSILSAAIQETKA